MVRFHELFAILLLALHHLHLPVFAAVSTASCDDLTSCSPAQCTVSSDPDCTFGTKVPDWSTALKTELTCKTCTVSTNSRCSAALSAARTSATGSSIQAIYCNDEYLIVAASGLPDSYDAGQSAPNELYLKGIPLPPGGNGGCRMRSAAAQLNVFKIPLSPTALADGASNTVPSPLTDVPGMPEAGAVAVAIDGVPMFPNYNNRGKFTWVSCEVDRCNAHSGKGEDYHYHGDFFGTKCLYSEADYGSDVDNTHPPQIGWALDGYDVFGRYTRTTQPGQDIALDSCGGHSHEPLGYHYHPEVDTTQTTNKLDGTNLGGETISYTAFKLAPMECWKGNVGLIPNFWSGKQVLYDSTKSGTLSTRADVEQLKPCCSMQSGEYFLKRGLQMTLGEGAVTGDGGAPSPSPTGVQAADVAASARSCGDALVFSVVVALVIAGS